MPRQDVGHLRCLRERSAWLLVSFEIEKWDSAWGRSGEWGAAMKGEGEAMKSCLQESVIYFVPVME